jgi:hypothetical protein
VHDGIGHLIDMHYGTAAHALVRRVTVTDDGRHIAAVRIEHTDHAPDCAGADIKTDKVLV